MFLIDFLFNLSIHLFGLDLFERSGALRPGDYVTRFGGIYGHPFVITHIAIVAAIAAVALRKRWMFVLAFIGFLINGTMRSPLALLLMLYVIIKLNLKFSSF